MKVYFDTEFTKLRKDATLISIGLISENDQTFYAEFSDYDKSQCDDDDWIKENVLNNLSLINKYTTPTVLNAPLIGNIGNIPICTKVFGDTSFIKFNLIKFFQNILKNSNDDKIELISDCCHYDMVLFIDIFGEAFDLPSFISPVCYDINQDIARYTNVSNSEAFDISREDFITINSSIKLPKGDKHNALYDAKVIKAIYEIINK